VPSKNQPASRSIVLAKGEKIWVYAYLFAKKDRANIKPDELAAFRKLAKVYEEKTPADLVKELKAGELMEICHDGKAQI